MSHRWTRASELLDLVLDAGSFESWDQPVDISDAPPDYRAELAAAAEKAGTDESVLTGRGLVRGRPVAVVVNEFGFLAGSIGRAAARRITAAVRRATAEGLPLLATTASAAPGCRRAPRRSSRWSRSPGRVMDHRAAGLPYLVYLRHPTTGGVYASWGSLAHVTVGEPGALIGFLGPQVFEALNGRAVPRRRPDRGEPRRHGVIDGVVAAEELPAMVDAVLARAGGPAVEPRLPRRTGELDPDRDAWAAIEETRGDDRIGVRDVLRTAAAGCVLPLLGHREGRARQHGARGPGPAGRRAVPGRRPGPEPAGAGQADGTGRAADRAAGDAAGQGAAAAAGHRDRHPGRRAVPARRGGRDRRRDRPLPRQPRHDDRPDGVGRARPGLRRRGAGAAPGQAVIVAEKAWLMPLPPEGASVIVHGDSGARRRQARQMRVRAVDLLANGTAHEVVPEPDGDTGEELAEAVAAEIAAAIRSLRE